MASETNFSTLGRFLFTAGRSTDLGPDAGIRALIRKPQGSFSLVLFRGRTRYDLRPASQTFNIPPPVDRVEEIPWEEDLSMLYQIARAAVPVLLLSEDPSCRCAESLMIFIPLVTASIISLRIDALTPFPRPALVFKSACLSF